MRVGLSLSRDVQGFYLADFSGMSVERLSLLRKRCREQQVEFRVIKNTLLKRAFNARGITELDAFQFRSLSRGSDGFFLKLSYLFRM